MNPEYEGVYAVLAKNSFAMMIQEGIDIFKREIASALCKYVETSDPRNETIIRRTLFCYEDLEYNLPSMTPRN